MDNWGWWHGDKTGIRSNIGPHNRRRSRPRTPSDVHPHGATPRGLRQRGRIHTVHTAYYCYWLSLLELSLKNVGDEPEQGGCDRARSREPARSGAPRPDDPRPAVRRGVVRWDAPRQCPGAAVPARRPATARPTARRLVVSRCDSSTATVEVFSMKFRVARDDLADAVAWVANRCRPPAGAGPRRDPARGQTGLRDADRLRLRLRDLRPRGRARRDDRRAPAGVLVSGRLLAEITRALPAKPVDLAVVGSRATIIVRHARFTLPTMPVEDYPPLPQMPQLAGTVAGRRVRRGRAQIAVAAGRDDTLPMLTGIRVEIEGASSRSPPPTGSGSPSASSSGCRTTPDISTAVLVPARTLADAAKTLGGAARSSSRSPGDGLLGLTGGGRRDHHPAAGRRVPEVPPAASRTSTRLPPIPVCRARRGDQAGRAGHRPRSPSCGMQFGEDGLRLTAGGDDEGRAEEELPCGSTAAADDRVQPGYLLDGLGALHTDAVQLRSPPRTGPPCCAQCRRRAPRRDVARGGGAPRTESGDDGSAGARARRAPAYLHLLMPVRLPRLTATGARGDADDVHWRARPCRSV